MLRRAMQKLVSWKDAPGRKPLVVNGARQVGKTWLVCEFARQHFGSIAHVTFLDNDQVKRIFSSSSDPRQILLLIGALTGTNPADGNTLVFLDEIQECPEAITALKLFCEQTPEVPVVAAGSLLGVALNRAASGRSEARQPRASWPVGKVSYLDLYPLTFDEFVCAVASPQLAQLVEGATGPSADADADADAPDTPNVANAPEAPVANTALNNLDALADQLTALLSQYFFVGGMPEAVRRFAETRDLAATRAVQSELLRGYELDFSKHVESPLMTERIRETWRSVPAQLARESDLKRFTYASIKAGARGRDYRDAVSWLVDAGLVIKVPRVSKPGIPLAAYDDGTHFKLYLADVGLLGAATHMDASVLVQGSRQFVEYKGAYAEQMVCQHLMAFGGELPRYWSADGKRAKGEIDFLVERGGSVLPVEVKAAGNIAGTSLARFCKAHGIEKAVRFSLLGHKDQGWLENVPLYALPAFLRQ